MGARLELPNSHPIAKSVMLNIVVKFQITRRQSTIAGLHWLSSVDCETSTKFPGFRYLLREPKKENNNAANI